MNKRYKKVLNQMRSDFFVYRKRMSFYKDLNLTEKELHYLSILKRDGICVIENYWSPEKCNNLKIQLTGYISEESDRDYDNGAYVRCNKNKKEKDGGVTRIYHVDKLMPTLQDFKCDPMIIRLASAYYGVPMYSSFIAFQHNAVSPIETREYHVDWWDKEFKAFIYLEDVELNNGPFSYLIGSNKAYYTRYKKMLSSSVQHSETSFFQRDLGKWIKKERSIVGKAGTLILADVVGFHRGLPQINAERTLLYNNLYSRNIEQFPEK